VYGCTGEEEAKKVLVNIKKRKDRAKRKRANGKDDEDEVSLISGCWHPD
jgi:ribosomal RNA-processing protein 12